MRILLDTHILLWAGAQSSKLSIEARSLLEDTDNLLYCNTASLWEIAIKTGCNVRILNWAYLHCAARWQAWISKNCPCWENHTEQLLRHPILHKDPFDCRLVAQSMAEPLVLLTKDNVLAQYWDGGRLI